MTETPPPRTRTATSQQAAVGLRILFVADRFVQRSAGTEGQMHQLATRLVAEGAECRLIVLQASEYLIEQGFPCPWEAVGCDRLSSPRLWAGLWRVGRRYRRAGYGLAHVFFNDASVVAPPMLSSNGMRVVISRRDMGFWYTPGYIRALRVTGRWVDRCVANSKAVAAHTQAQERIPPSAMHVIYNGLSVAGSEAPGPAQPDRLVAGPDAVVAVLVANVRPIKRIGDLITALGALRASHPRLHVAIIGGGDNQTLRNEARRLGVAQRVHFLGVRDDVRQCLKRADIGVLCSESEGFSNAIIEYMSAGLPVVCTRAGGNPEAIQHGETGLLYPVGDTHALAGHLARLADDAALRREFGIAGRVVAQVRFSVDRMVSDHVALYRELLREPAT